MGGSRLSQPATGGSSSRSTEYGVEATDAQERDPPAAAHGGVDDDATQGFGRAGARPSRATHGGTQMAECNRKS